MTPQDIRAAIQADPALLALVPDTHALAQALSQGRTKVQKTEVGNGTILQVLGLTKGNVLLDLIYTDPAYRYVKPLFEQGRADFSAPLLRQAVDELVTLEQLTSGEAAALKALAEVPDPVDEFSVRCALFHDDGTLAVTLPEATPEA